MVDGSRARALRALRDDSYCFAGRSRTWMFFSCVKASISSKHSSRPMPDCLYAAERRAEEMLADLVDPDESGLDRGGGAVRGREIVGPDRGGEAVFDRIDLLEHLAPRRSI